MKHFLSQTSISGLYNSIIYNGLGSLRRPAPLRMASAGMLKYSQLWPRYVSHKSSSGLGQLPKNIGNNNQTFCNLNQQNTMPVIGENNWVIVNDSRKYSSRVNLQSLQPQKKKGGFYIVLRILKIICLITGISVWTILVVVLFMIDELKFEKSDKMDLSSSEPWSLIRTMKFLGIVSEEENDDIEALLKLHDNDKVKFELNEKINAFQDVWSRLREEDGVKLSLGNPVEICGYKCSTDKGNDDSWCVDKEDKKTKWIASCYVEGNNGTAILSILFERHHTESEWVATKVHLEKVKESGEVICNVSSNLPNGLRNFTRLSDT